MVLAFKVFAANWMHHLELPWQLVDAERLRELVGLLGIGGDGGNNGGDRDRVLALLEITHSLGSAPYGTRLAARRRRHSSAAAAARPVGAGAVRRAGGGHGGGDGAQRRRLLRDDAARAGHSSMGH